MYQYDLQDQRHLQAQIDQFRDQIASYLSGDLTPEEFRPLRLLHGLYELRHATMLRIAVPYGMASSEQFRTLARVSRKYGLGDLHFTARQNVQVNFAKLEEVADILDELAGAQINSTQTSGSCVRGIVSDPLAGARPDEIADPRPWCELLRQWSQSHPEYTHLPKKFKIALGAAPEDRGLLFVHDLGLELRRDEQGEIGFRVCAGGGLGRLPMIGRQLLEFLPWRHLLSFCEAVVRVYDQHGRRDDPSRKRSKILVQTLGIDAFRALIEQEWEGLRDGPRTLTEADFARVARHFTEPAFAADGEDDDLLARERAGSGPFASWLRHNVRAHRHPGHAIVLISTKRPGVPPGDVSPDQMDRLADLAERYSFGEIRVTPRQNLVLAHVRQSDLPALWEALAAEKLATPNIHLLTDLAACPGGRYCDLSLVATHTLSEALAEHFAGSDLLEQVGPIDLAVSGCSNGCAHHSVAHIGVRGVEKGGRSFYQISIGGDQWLSAAIGRVIGPSVPLERVPVVIEGLLRTWLRLRQDGETFIDTVRRIGPREFARERPQTLPAGACGKAARVAAAGRG